jgi:hypothetical protein
LGAAAFRGISPDAGKSGIGIALELIIPSGKLFIYRQKL